MTTECTRAWQAEAVEDGRLSRADTESFQRHAATCACCAREVRLLETLRTVGQRLPTLASTSLEQRRLRQAVLRAANDLALHPRPAPRRHALVLGAIAVALVALLASWPPAQGEQRTAPVAGAPTFQIETSKGAAWTARSEARTVRLHLASGWFEISVDKLKTAQRFILELPDGELEVKGTRFIVEVQGAKTARVRVHEGRVALRLRGQPSLLLEAGATWPPIAAAPAPSSGPNELAAAPIASAPSTAPKTAPVRVPETPAEQPSRGTDSAPEASGTEATPVAGDALASGTEATPVAGDAFAQAMAAFTAGDFGKAERLFGAFEQAHPADARVEDATFLMAVARARRGDLPAARAIARDYLRRYPQGLRRAEAERLLR